jgi:hypothetical protein
MLNSNGSICGGTLGNCYPDFIESGESTFNIVGNTTVFYDALHAGQVGHSAKWTTSQYSENGTDSPAFDFTGAASGNGMGFSEVNVLNPGLLQDI